MKTTSALAVFGISIISASSFAATPIIPPGDGYPGRVEAYAAEPPLKAHLERYGLTAWWFRRDAVDMRKHKIEARKLPVNELPYLLYTPKRGQQPVPLVVYFSGTGEQGTNLVEHFRQTTIFSKTTDPDFQKRHPCYLLAPMTPKDGAWLLLSGLPEQRSPMKDLLCDAIYAAVREAKNPPIDTNRIYLTGLSYGGAVTYSLHNSYPGRFAAGIPVSSLGSVFTLPQTNPGNYWLLYNEETYKSEPAQKRLDDFARAVKERGGDFRSSHFPDKGHDAWSKAWREDIVWDWMFSKTADGNPISQPAKAATPVTRQKRAGMFLDDAICAASKPGRDDGTGPERAADGLEATCYVSAEPMKRGDWWQIEFAEPASGRIIVKSGFRDGNGRSSTARVETSSDGRMWMRHGTFSSASGECRITLRAPIKYLRVLPDSLRGEILVLREVEVASD